MGSHKRSPADPSSIRELIEDPPEQTGMLVIAHDFKWLTSDSPAPDEAVRRMRHALRKLRDLGYPGIICNVSERNYLKDEEAWRLFQNVLEEAGLLGLRVWIYDEAGYPSGAAGGSIPREHPEFEAVGLVRLVDDVAGGPVRLEAPLGYRYAVAGRAFLREAVIDVADRFGEDGEFVWDPPEACRVERYCVRRAFEGTHATLNVCAVRRYINVLDPAAVRAFIDSTYAQYVSRFPRFIASIDAVFTDEPSFMTTYHPALPDMFTGQIRVEDEPDPRVPRLPMVPWWEGLPAAFRAAYGYDLTAYLQCLFEEAPEGIGAAQAARVRQDFHELLARQYAAAYFGQIQGYLDGYGIALTGHVLHEEPLWHHAGSEGSAMLALAPMRIPGCDILTARPERIVNTMLLLTPKYASSAAHLHGRPQVMCEISDWEERNRGTFASLEERFGTLALVAMLGVTTFASYFRWNEFADEDLARVCSAVRRIGAAVRAGVHRAGIGVLYPIRAIWARHLPTAHWVGSAERPDWLVELEESLYHVALSLLSTQRDFDFVDEDLLLQGKPRPGGFRIAGEDFDILILPPGAILSEGAAAAVKEFARAGGGLAALRPEPAVQRGDALKGTSLPLRDFLGSAGEVSVFERGDQGWLETVAERVRPALRFDPPAPGLFVRRSRIKDGELFLVTNTRPEPWRGLIGLPDGAGDCEIRDPWTGETSSGEVSEVGGYGARILIAGFSGGAGHRVAPGT